MAVQDYSSSLPKAFGATLRALRRSKGFSQEELGFRSGVHRTYIGELERGQKIPTIAMLARIAHPLALRPSELIRAAEVLASKRRKR